MADQILSARRALVCVAVGAVDGLVAAVAAAPRLAPLVAWCTAGLVALVWVWRICWPLDQAGTERLAREESASHVTDDAIIAVCLASLAAMVVALIQSSNQTGDPISVALIILGVLGTLQAWALVNTVYAFKSARVYFLDHHERADSTSSRRLDPPTATSPIRPSPSGCPTPSPTSNQPTPTSDGRLCRTLCCPTCSAQD